MQTTFHGSHCSGIGNPERLQLLDDCFSMLHPTPKLPYLGMLYNPLWNSYREGYIWGCGWWIQNSYGFAYSAVPLLSRPWCDMLQAGLDQFWNRMGDGRRIGADDQIPNDNAASYHNLKAPDGCLGDAVVANSIAYKQGDGRIDLHDWFYEATAAGIVMQAELLLKEHDAEKANAYIPKILRSCAFIEGARDPDSDLFLVGPACNLLAPSYGGSYNEETGEVGKGYLTGLLVTYSAALRKMIQVFSMTGDLTNQFVFEKRLRKNLNALPQLMTNEGYLVKSVDPDGTPHGIYGAKRYGYFESVCNVDAIAMKVVSDETADAIYRKLASIPELRPFDFLANNYPHLDDTYMNYLQRSDAPGLLMFPAGDWVDGGCWGTVEGRAILSYMRLGEYGDAFSSASRMMRWALDYRLDAPMSQYGENKYNSWNEEYPPNPGHPERGADPKPIGVMIDDFAVPAALLRGLMGYEYDADGITLEPHIPDDIDVYVQHEPVYFRDKEITITVSGHAGVPVMTLNGTPIQGTRLLYDQLGDVNRIEIRYSDAIPIPEAISRPLCNDAPKIDLSVLPPELVEIARACGELDRESGSMPKGAGIFLREIKAAVDAAAARRELPFDQENFRPMTDKKKAAILELYDSSAKDLYAGLCRHYTP